MENKNQLYYLERYARWEEKRKMFRWKLFGVSIWEYIRFSVFEIIDFKLKDVKYYNNYYYIKENTSNLIPRVIKEIPKKILKQRDVLFVNMSRRQEIDNVYYSPFLDGLVTELNYSYAILEARAKVLRDIEIITPNVIFYDPDNLGTRISKNIMIDNSIERLIKMVEKDFKISLSLNDKEYISKNIYSVIQNKKLFSIYYKIILKLIKPKLIVIVGAALQYNRYLIEVAKEMKIPTVEYEHGFGNACCMEDYYSKLYNLKSYVDYRWTYGKGTIYSLKLPIDGKRIVPVGNVFHNQRVKELKNKYFEEKINSDKKNILIISDYNISSRLANLAVEVSNLLDKDKYRVIFKLHPGEADWRNKYPCLINSQIIVKGMDNKNDINYYILHSYCVVGSTSTALAEAVELGKKVYVYGKSPYAICSEFLYNFNYATLFFNAEELALSVLNEQVIENNVELYENEPIVNINKAIENILNKC